MGDDTDMTFLLRHKLSDREVFCIGDIVVLWRCLSMRFFCKHLTRSARKKSREGCRQL
jgi:hypothetical protein